MPRYNLQSKLRALSVKEFDPNSLYCFNYKSKFRKAIVWLATLNWFDRIVMVLIFANSIFLSIYDYQDRNDTGYRNQLIGQSGTFFTIVFTIECAVKVISMGFICNKSAYLRDGWNWIDFVVVIVG